MSLNSCQFMGHLGQDVELKFLPTGKAVVNFSIACGEKWKDKETGELKEHTEWIRAICFGKKAEAIEKYFEKGSQIFIQGKQRTRDYEKDGVKHWVTEIIVSDFQFCGQRSDGSSAKTAQQEKSYGQDQEYDSDGFGDAPF